MRIHLTHEGLGLLLGTKLYLPTRSIVFDTSCLMNISQSKPVIPDSAINRMSSCGFRIRLRAPFRFNQSQLEDYDIAIETSFISFESLGIETADRPNCNLHVEWGSLASLNRIRSSQLFFGDFVEREIPFTIRRGQIVPDYE